MKILISIKKKWLQHRVYKYTLKYKHSLSKSNAYLKLANSYLQAANLDYFKLVAGGPYYNRYCELHKKYTILSDYHKSLSEIYLDKKLDSERELKN